MSREDSRKGLLKFMGKAIKYEGVVKAVNDKKVLLIDVSQFGKTKILAQHLWIDKTTGVTIGSRVMFSAIAGSYLDSYGIRKYNLYSIRNLAPYDTTHEEVLHDVKNYRRRK